MDRALPERSSSVKGLMLYSLQQIIDEEDEETTQTDNTTNAGSLLVAVDADNAEDLI